MTDKRLDTHTHIKVIYQAGYEQLDIKLYIAVKVSYTIIQLKRGNYIVLHGKNDYM